MTKHLIIANALFLIYFNIGGLATTNILRLTKGNTLPIHATNCTCDNCGASIPPLLQLPIISYIICKGKCRSCGCKIPIYPLVLEVCVFVGMSLISALASFTLMSIFMSFLYYEIVRIIMVIIKGKREHQFNKQYVIAVVSMIQFVVPCLFVSYLYQLV